MGTTSLGIAFPDPDEPPRRQDLEDLATSADAAIAAAIGSGWSTYTPVWATNGATQPNIGNGTISGAYRQFGQALVAFHIRLLIGSTTTNGSGTYSLSVPVAINPRGRWSFSGSVRDVSAPAFWRLTTVQSGLTLNLFVDGGVNGSLRSFTDSVPFELAAGDEINLHGHYEPA